MKCIDCGWYNAVSLCCEELRLYIADGLDIEEERDCLYYITTEERINLEEFNRIEQKGW